MLSLFMTHLQGYKKEALKSPILIVLEVICELLLPLVMAQIVDTAIPAGDVALIFKLGALMLVLAAASMTCGVLASKYAAFASQGFGANLRQCLFDKVQEFSFADIDRFSSASLITRMTNDVNNMTMMLAMGLRMLVRAPVMLIVAAAVSCYLNAKLALILVVIIPLMMIVIGLLMYTCTRLFKVLQTKIDNLNNTLQENLVAIRVVKAFVREDYENRKFSKASSNLYRMFVKAEGLLAFNSPAMMTSVYFCIIMISWLGSHFIVAGDMSSGNLTSLFSYVMSLLMSLMMLSMVVVMISMSMASIRRISEVLEETPDLHNPEQPVMEVADGSIDFDHVSFSYKHGSGKSVLTDINLHIKAGETIGVIGGTGAGKSSLVNLICRLYDVDEGAVKVGGLDVRQYDMEALREQVSVVLQKNTLFSGTILDNLRWGNPNATEEECVAACQAACADEFIDRFPDGYHTRIERGGANVSGGQKQRLCIARALLKKPKVLILDDSTSAVDTATDAKIRAAFAQRIPGTTKIIIAQRISSVEHADRILVLDNGRIDGFDTHEHLLETNAIYREIYDSQVQGGGDFDQPA